MSGTETSTEPIVVTQLRARLGTDAVLVDAATLSAYSHDTWPLSTLESQLDIHTHRPDVVVLVRSEDDVLAVLEVAREAGIPVVARGLGSSVTGQPLPTRGGVVLDLSGLGGEPILHDTDLTVTVPAGVRGSDLEAWLHERGLTHNFTPQSLDRSSVGGWLATRATGQLSSKYGGIEVACVAARVALSDGSVITLGQRPRAAVGPDLLQLFLGSEGMFGVVLEVTLRVYRITPSSLSEAWTFGSLEDGMAALRTIYQSGIRPALMRLYDAVEAGHAVGDSAGGLPVLFLTHDGLQGPAAADHAASREIVESLGGTSLGSGPVEAWYGRRYDFSTIERLLAEPGGYAETVEVAHLWSGLPTLYTELTTALAPYADEVLGHFSHVYTNGASLYVILLGRAPSNAEARDRLARIWQVAMETTTRVGGELSHHHGAGLARQEYIPENLGSQHELLRRVQLALDPAQILNPGHLGL